MILFSLFVPNSQKQSYIVNQPNELNQAQFQDINDKIYKVGATLNKYEFLFQNKYEFLHPKQYLGIVPIYFVNSAASTQSCSGKALYN